METHRNSDIDHRCGKIEQNEKVEDNKRTTKVCNKFSIDSILGITSQNDDDGNDVVESNQLNFIDFYERKGELIKVEWSWVLFGCESVNFWRWLSASIRNASE